MAKGRLLEVQNLHTEFHTEDEVVKAVNGISFELLRGETIGIVGESGSGKSVTALSIMKLIQEPPGKITEGRIVYHSAEQGTIDLLQTPEKEMRKYRGNDIAMIFQEPMTSLNPVYTCGNQVMESLLLHKNISRKEARAKTIELFKEVELPRPEFIFNTYPHQISGGQKQRVMIAMAMSCDPAILIADEPTTALDVTIQKTILELMESLQLKHNMGIMFITHDLGVVAELADRVIVMYKGKIVEQGKVKNIFSNPQHPYTKGLLACRPNLDQRMYWLPTVSDFMKVDDSGTIREGASSIQEVIEEYSVKKDDRKVRHENLYAKEPILKIKDLQTWFPLRKNLLGKTIDYVRAVDGVSFEVFPGETLGLVGESGCGKTTLGRSILQLVQTRSGSIEFNGNNITELNGKEMRSLRKDIQIIFQDPYSSLNPRMTIGEAIIEPMRVHNILENEEKRKERVLELLGRVNMDERHYYRYPHEFSGGQRQRICIARALALNPRFIICDESVSALDVSVQAQVLNLLNELQREFNLTYIFISHDLSIVKFMSDRMVVMQNGRVEEMGEADALYANPKTDYTKKLIDSIPKGRLSDIETALERRKLSRDHARPVEE